MSELSNTAQLARSVLASNQLFRVSLPLNLYFAKYLGGFKLVDVDGQLIIHSHLPAVNSPAYQRFVREHLIERVDGPSHAQIAVTNACRQRCSYCYNKNRSGERLTTLRIKELIQELKSMGVFWLGLTGGEPQLNRDLVDIVASAGDGMAVKLFTTGDGTTDELASDLKRAGLASVSVSLDHWEAAEHDRVRGCEGAFDTALAAIECYKHAGLHVGVSSVVSRQMLQEGQVETFLEFLVGLGVHEAWLSETKPSSSAFWDPALVITEEERRELAALQDRYNKQGRITVNYLGHFEGPDHFGCEAGNKMVYIDAFGEVSPCVFTPMTFGNVRETPLREIFCAMKSRFPTESGCFINRNWELVQKHAHGKEMLSKEDSEALMAEVEFGPPAEFIRLFGDDGAELREASRERGGKR